MRIRTMIGHLSAGMLLMVLAAPAHAVPLAFAELEINGQALDGHVSQTEVGGVDVSSNHIEVDEFAQTVAQKQSKKGIATGKVGLSRIVIRKRQDQTSPLFIDAVVRNQVLSGTIKFFTADDAGAPQLESTVGLADARVVSVEQVLPSSPGHPLSEVVTIVPSSQTWTNVLEGTSTTYDF